MCFSSIINSFTVTQMAYIVKMVYYLDNSFVRTLFIFWGRDKENKFAEKNFSISKCKPKKIW